MNRDSPSAQVSEWLNDLPSRQRAIVDELRRHVASVRPEAHEFIHHNSLSYGLTDKAFTIVIYLAVYEKYVRLGFFFGGMLDDPDALLMGTGKRMRHIKITGVEDTRNAAIKSLLEQSFPIAEEHYRMATTHRRNTRAVDSG